MIKVYSKHGEVIGNSHNLRIVQDRARRLYRKHLAPAEIYADKRTLCVNFPDGSYVRHEFADAGVLREYVANRIKFGPYRFAAPKERY